MIIKKNRTIKQATLLPLLGASLWLASISTASATLANAGVSGTQDWPTPASNAVLSSTLVSNGQATVTNYSSTGFDLVVQNNGSTTANGASIRSNIAAFSSNGGFIRFLGTTPGTISYADIRANQGIFDLTSIKIGSADTTITYPITFTITPLDSSFNPIAGASVTSPQQTAQLISSQDNWITFTPTGSTQIANFTGIYGVRIVQSSGIQVNCDAITVNNPRLPSTVATVTTPTSASITSTGATLGGNVTADGGATVSERGVVYALTSTNGSPQISGTGVTKVSTSGTTGVFTVSSGALTPGTQYSFAAYATNSAGTAYSAVGTFTTLNNNAGLTSMTLSSGTLSPSFSSGTTSYTATVANAVASTTVTATTTDSNATMQVRINGGSYAALSSGVASSSLPLNVGANTIDVLVTAQDGITTSTYTTTVTRAPSSISTLSSLSLSAGALSPSFSSGTTSYTAAVANAVATTTVTAITTDTNATMQVRINGGSYTALSSGVASGSLALNVGANTINVLVTAQDGITTSTYTTTVTRAASSNSTLSSLSLSAGALSPSFSSGTTSYTASVANTVTSTTITATTSDANATLQVRINGGSYTTLTSGVASSSLTLNVGANPIDVLVTAQDGTTTSTYTTTVTRAKSSNAGLTSLSLSSGTLSPAFSSGTTSYTATVLRPTAAITATPTAADNNATLQIRLNGGSYSGITSGTASGSLALNLGANTIDVLVTAQDGTTTSTYTTTVTRWTYLQGWRNQYFSTINNSGSAADTATPQNDGIANLMKFALGMNPTVTGVTPTSVGYNSGTSTLTFSYQRSVQAMAECTFIVEWSDTLLSSSWSNTGVTEQINSDNGTVQQVTASIPASGQTRRFARLRVTNP